MRLAPTLRFPGANQEGGIDNSLVPNMCTSPLRLRNSPRSIWRFWRAQHVVETSEAVAANGPSIANQR
jgi:hypothetical protein